MKTPEQCVKSCQGRGSGVLISNFEYKKLKDQIVVKRYKIYLNKF